MNGRIIAGSLSSAIRSIIGGSYRRAYNRWSA